MEKPEFIPQCAHLNWLVGELDGWQFGEQGLIASVYDTLKCDGVSVEYGAGDGDRLPLTIDRIYQRSPTSSVLVEIDMERCRSLSQNYPGATVESRLSWQDYANRDVSVVVIDIDGLDSVVLTEMLESGVQPDIIVCEHMDRHYPCATSFADPIPKWMLGMRFKSGHAIQDTAETLHQIAGKFGYERFGLNRCNSFFVRGDKYQFLFR